jgi:SAM-dependent methyltransferase
MADASHAASSRPIGADHKMIDYDHALNCHTVQGARGGLAAVIQSANPRSLLDVGCGTGTWLRAAQELGVNDILGIDGVKASVNLLQVEASKIRYLDLTEPFDIGRRFDLVLCLEVAEHLPESAAVDLITSICRHTDRVLFSAACPGQPGQHHINCQWPIYWQSIFNQLGFVCDDTIRWQLWGLRDVEPWYRQNIFWAERNATQAGSERRLEAVVHPEMFPIMRDSAIAADLGRIENGWQPMNWYLHSAARAAIKKVGRQARSLLTRHAADLRQALHKTS